MKKAVIFDLDGTLIHSLPDIAAAMNRSLRAWGLPEHPEEAYKYMVGDGAVNLAPNLIADDGSVAMRITNEPFSKELCYRFQKALVSTSANISGEPPAQNYCDITPQLLESVDYVCFSRRQEKRPHKPSSIIKLSKDGVIQIIRK